MVGRQRLGRPRLESRYHGIDSSIDPAPAKPGRTKTRTETSLGINVGGVIAVAGATAAIVGTFLTMFDVRLGPLSGTTAYWDADNDGKLVAGLAAGVIVVAIASLLHPRPNGFAVAIAFAAAAAAAARIALYDRIDLDRSIDSIDDLRRNAGDGVLGQVAATRK